MPGTLHKCISLTLFSLYYPLWFSLSLLSYYSTYWVNLDFWTVSLLHKVNISAFPAHTQWRLSFSDWMPRDLWSTGSYCTCRGLAGRGEFREKSIGSGLGKVKGCCSAQRVAAGGSSHHPQAIIVQGELEPGRASPSGSCCHVIQEGKGMGGGSNFFLLLPLIFSLAKPIPASKGSLMVKFVSVSLAENRTEQRRMENGSRDQQRITSLTILKPVVWMGEPTMAT